MPLRQAALAVFVAAALIASTSTGCSNDDDDGACAVSDASNSCAWEPDRVRSCAAVTTGIYGTASWSCAAHCVGNGCSATTLTATDTAGHVTKVMVASGFFAIALGPERYDVCTTGGAPVVEKICATVTVPAGQAVRVDYAIAYSPGGAYESLHVRGTEGMPCDPAHGASLCDDGLGCVPGSAPSTGTCQPIAVSSAGGPCDLPYSRNQTHACATGLTCTPSSADASVKTCTSFSARGGPCGDGAHACDNPYSIHCDEPSRLCIDPSSSGAWCRGGSDRKDCDENAGFECLDARGHLLESDATATCVARRAPGAACDQGYQCASLYCVTGVCMPLLAAGADCIFASQCASAACPAGLCR